MVAFLFPKMGYRHGIQTLQTFWHNDIQVQAYMHGRQFGLICAGDSDAFESAFSEVLVTMRMHSFFSLVQVMKGSERRHTHVAY